jgi:hypothetical protein
MGRVGSFDLTSAKNISTAKAYAVFHEAKINMPESRNAAVPCYETPFIAWTHNSPPKASTTYHSYNA